MNAKQAGFTLIELVIVIVVLGILAVAAIPKYIDIVSEARVAATQGVAGGLASASATNFAIRSGFSTKGDAIASCTAVGNAMAGGAPTGYTITPTTAITNGGTLTCTVTGPGPTTANFVAHGIS
jgi:MSHA pilin protein MshA